MRIRQAVSLLRWSWLKPNSLDRATQRNPIFCRLVAAAMRCLKPAPEMPVFQKFFRKFYLSFSFFCFIVQHFEMFYCGNQKKSVDVISSSGSFNHKLRSSHCKIKFPRTVTKTVSQKIFPSPLKPRNYGAIYIYVLLLYNVIIIITILTVKLTWQKSAVKNNKT